MAGLNWHREFAQGQDPCSNTTFRGQTRAQQPKPRPHKGKCQPKESEDGGWRNPERVRTVTQLNLGLYLAVTQREVFCFALFLWGDA